jgi:hypothetical protein
MVFDKSWKRAGVLATLAVALAVGGGCGGGDDDDGGGGASGESVELSFLVDNSDQSVKPAQALIDAFQQDNRTSRSTWRRVRRAETATTWSRPGSPPRRWPTSSPTTRARCSRL